MNPSSQYVSGRTVQEQMQQLMDYVEVKSEEVAAAKAEEVLEPAQQAKTDAEAARDRAEAAAAQTVDCVKKTGTDVPQVISGTGGLQVAGDVSVGGDLTVGGSLHADVSNAEIAGMAIEKSGSSTRLSNENGISINGLYLSDMVSKARNDAQQMQGDLRIVNPGETGDSVQTKAQVAAAMDSYSQVVRTTGNQNVGGQKNFTVALRRTSALYNHTIDHSITNMKLSDIPGSGAFFTVPIINLNDSDDAVLGDFAYSRATTYTAYNIRIRDSQGRNATLSLRANEDGTVALYLVGTNGTREIAKI